MNVITENSKSSGGFDRKGKVIISLLTVLIMVATSIGVLLWKNSQANSDIMPESTQSKSSTSTSSISEAQPEKIDLATVEMESVHETPIPDAPASWGEYVLDSSWESNTRVFQDVGPETLPGNAGSKWLSSSNGCGAAVYLVTFRAVNENATLTADIVDFNESTISQASAKSGWMLFTNCSTPRIQLENIEGQSTLTDVTYEVFQYSQAVSNSEGQQSGVEAESLEEDVTPTSEVQSEPIFVECVGGLTAYAYFSDGSQRFSENCVAQQQESAKGESWCGGLYAPPEASREEFVALCNREPNYGP